MSALLSPQPRFVTPPRRNPQNPPYDVWPQIAGNLQNQNPPAGLFPAFHSPPESATPHSIHFPGSPYSSRDGKASKFETKHVNVKPLIKGVDFGSGWALGNHGARGAAPALLPRPAVDLRGIRCVSIAIYGCMCSTPRPSGPCCTDLVRFTHAT